ncbi:hypothetical protein ONZ45_g14515 [Pleurotus djamor]|nr:hypothetical protein ONZ45_g14515 [Pleurotus djamor]
MLQLQCQSDLDSGFCALILVVVFSVCFIDLLFCNYVFRLFYTLLIINHIFCFLNTLLIFYYIFYFLHTRLFVYIFPTSSTAAPSASSTPVQLRLAENTGKCLVTHEEFKTNGAPIEINSCNSSERWTYKNGTTPIELAGGSTRYCIDSGSDKPQNGDLLAIRQCDGSRPQTWNYNDAQKQFSQTGADGKKLCIDVTNAKVDDGTLLQVFTCTDGNTNQAWVNK